MYDVGQATRAHYAAASLIRNPAGFPKAATEASGAASVSLNVLIEQRHGVVRIFLNMDQLLRDCSDSEDLQGASVSCRSATFASDLAWCAQAPNHTLAQYPISKIACFASHAALLTRRPSECHEIIQMELLAVRWQP